MVFAYIDSLTVSVIKVCVKIVADALFLAKLGFQQISRKLKSPETIISIRICHIEAQFYLLRMLVKYHRVSFQCSSLSISSKCPLPCLQTKVYKICIQQINFFQGNFSLPFLFYLFLVAILPSGPNEITLINAQSYVYLLDNILSSIYYPFWGANYASI